MNLYKQIEELQMGLDLKFTYRNPDGTYIMMDQQLLPGPTAMEFFTEVHPWDGFGDGPFRGKTTYSTGMFVFEFPNNRGRIRQLTYEHDMRIARRQAPGSFFNGFKDGGTLFIFASDSSGRIYWVVTLEEIKKPNLVHTFVQGRYKAYLTFEPIRLTSWIDNLVGVDVLEPMNIDLTKNSEAVRDLLKSFEPEVEETPIESEFNKAVEDYDRSVFNIPFLKLDEYLREQLELKRTSIVNHTDVTPIDIKKAGDMDSTPESEKDDRDESKDRNESIKLTLEMVAFTATTQKVGFGAYVGSDIQFTITPKMWEQLGRPMQIEVTGRAL